MRRYEINVNTEKFQRLHGDVDFDPPDPIDKEAEWSLCGDCNGLGEDYMSGRECRSCRGLGEIPVID